MNFKIMLLLFIFLCFLYLPFLFDYYSNFEITMDINSISLFVCLFIFISSFIFKICVKKNRRQQSKYTRLILSRNFFHHCGIIKKKKILFLNTKSFSSNFQTNLNRVTLYIVKLSTTFT